MLNEYAVNSYARAFIRKSNSACAPYRYLACLAIDGLEASKADSTIIYCPSDTCYDAFDTLTVIKGVENRPTTTFRHWFTKKSYGVLESLYKDDCEYDVHIHFGDCEHPGAFNEFEKAIVFRGVLFQSYSLSSLIPKTPEERAMIEETTSVSMDSWYSFIKPVLSRRVIQSEEHQGPGLAVAHSCDNCCVDCEPCTECPTDFSLTWDVDPDECCSCAVLRYSKNCGATVGEINLTCLPALDKIINISMHVVGDTLYIVLQLEGGSTQIIAFDVSALTNGDTQISKGVCFTNTANFQVFGTWESGSYIYAVGLGGKVHRYGLDCQDEDISGTETTDLYAIGGLRDDYYVYGGADGLVYINDNGSVTSSTVPSGSDVRAIEVLGENYILVGTNDGIWIYCPCEDEWRQTYAGGCVLDFAFVDTSIGYAIINRADGTSDILLTVDGGLTWSPVYLNPFNPESLEGVNLTSISVCSQRPSNFLASGYSDTAETDPCSLTNEYGFDNFLYEFRGSD